MSKDTVSKLLASFFKEDKTRRKLTKHLAVKNFRPADSSSFLCVAVSGDAATLMAEMLRIFVRGEKRLQLYRRRWQRRDVSCLMSPEAAVRAQKQAEAEDCDQVDIEHFEKILPQLVGGHHGNGCTNTVTSYSA